MSFWVPKQSVKQNGVDSAKSMSVDQDDDDGGGSENKYDFEAMANAL